ncbi:cupin domain-containing protein [Fusobacterium sp.]|uniref:cupin domain-containing protein n=1 Tax=Fusobacterium sp. TaxID=68766 RepID=UPI0025BDFCA5|nr:cupin domain-containing protein [Fusobacterium sp.]
MKKLICAKDVEEIIESGKKKIVITKNTLLTPAAKDIIDLNKIEVVTEKIEEKKESFSSIEIEKLIEVFKLFAQDEEMKKTIESLLLGKEFEQIIDEKTGFIQTKQKDMKFRTINSNNLNIKYQEFIHQDGKDLSIVKIEKSQFLKKIFQDEIVYVISGDFEIKIDETTYKISEGDTLYIPKKVHKVQFLIKDSTKLFYQSQNNTWKQDIIEGGEYR